MIVVVVLPFTQLLVEQFARRLSIEYVRANLDCSCARAIERGANLRGVEKQRPAGWVGRRVCQQLGGDEKRLIPAAPVFRPIAFAVAPPRELAWWPLASFTHDGTRRRGKILAANPVQNRPAYRNHAVPAFAPGFEVKGKRETVLLVLDRCGIHIYCRKQDNNEYGPINSAPGRQYTTFLHGNVLFDQVPFDRQSSR